MTIVNISRSNFHERMLPTRRRSKQRPPDHKSDAHPTEPPKPADTLFEKPDNFVTYCLLYFKLSYLSKGVHLLKGRMAPRRNKFFPFRVDSLSDGRQTIFIKLSPLKM